MEQTQVLVFYILTFSSLSEEFVRKQVLKLVSLPLWHALSTARQEQELKRQKSLAKPWSKIAKGNGAEQTLLPSMLREYVQILQSIQDESDGTNFN